MPLRALLDNKNTHAFTYSKEDWNKLKKRYREHSLIMPCCKTQAIPKTSNLQNHFFAHKSREECLLYKTENSKQLLFKTIIAKTAQELGWHVETEYQVFSDTHEPLNVDILCQRNGIKIGFKLQWSPQQKQTFEDTQDKLKKQGIQNAWFYQLTKQNQRQINLSSYKTPVFSFIEDKHNHEFIISDFDLKLSLFIKKLLQKEINWQPSKRQIIKGQIIKVKHLCKACSTVSDLIYEVRLYNEEDIQLGTYPFDNPYIAELIFKYVDETQLEDKLIGKVISRNDFLSRFVNSCYHCGAAIDVKSTTRVISAKHKMPSLKFEFRVDEVPNDIGKWLLQLP